MHCKISLFSFVILYLSLINPAIAAVVTIEGTVKSIDTTKPSITVQTKSDDKELDVSRNAKVNIEGASANLNSLKVGQKVKVSYHDGLGVALKIDAMPLSIALFNGKNLNGWSPLPKRKKKQLWVVDANRNTLVSVGNGFNELKTDAIFKNFRLILEWRFTPNKFVSPNGSGVIVRSNGMNTAGTNPKGIEIDIRPQNYKPKKIGTGTFIAYSMPIKNYLGESDGEKNRIRGWLREPKERPQGEWNKCEIVCKGDRIKVTFNGDLVNEGWGVPVEAGHICLRNQNSAVEFRDIQIEVLD